MTHAHQAQSLVTTKKKVRRKRAPWITITGGKGGVGKTLISVNLAALAARAGHRTLLLDLDPGLANLDVHLRLAPKYTVEDLAEGRCRLDEALVAGPYGMSVLCGQSGSTRLAGGDKAFIDKVMAAADRAARSFDLVICDTGAGIGPSVITASKRAQLTLAVTNPDPGSITDTYALCKLLLGTKTAKPHLVVNRVRSREDAMRVGARFAAVCRKFLHHKLPLAGWLQSDQQVESSVSQQKPFVLSGSGTAMDDLQALTASALSNLPALKRSQRVLKAPARRQAIRRNLR
ncbi:MAG: MinD/ParA family ATP-binding protein [Planctomycetota bacterium]|jgi:flagellar biosynthesis protein FlhG